MVIVIATDCVCSCLLFMRFVLFCCNANSYVFCEVKITYLLTYLLLITYLSCIVTYFWILCVVANHRHWWGMT